MGLWVLFCLDWLVVILFPFADQPVKDTLLQIVFNATGFTCAMKMESWPLNSCARTGWCTSPLANSVACRSRSTVLPLGGLSCRSPKAKADVLDWMENGLSLIPVTNILTVPVELKDL